VLWLSAPSSIHEIAYCFIRSFYPQLTVGSRHVLNLGRNKCWRTLCAQAGEGAGVGDVGTGLGSTTASTAAALATSTTLTAAATSTELATAFAATTSLTTELTATTTTTLAATEFTTATAASSSGTTLTGRGGKHLVTVKFDVDLLLAGTFTLGLAL